MIGPKGNSKFCLPETLNVSRDEGEELILGTLSNRRRRPDDGNRKREISFETSLRMYKTLWPDVALKLSWTCQRGVSRRDENLSTSCFCFDPFSVLLCYFRAEPR